MIATKTYLGIRNAKTYHKQVHLYALVNSSLLVLLCMVWVAAYYMLMTSYQLLPPSLLLPGVVMSSCALVCFNFYHLYNKWSIAQKLFPRLIISPVSITLQKPLVQFYTCIPWTSVQSLTIKKGSLSSEKSLHQKDTIHHLTVSANDPETPSIELVLEHFVDPKEFLHSIFPLLPTTIKYAPSRVKIHEMFAL